jgi:hypothetical protein
VKAAFLISLPSEMDKIVDNLQTKADLSYADIHARLMDLAANKSTPSTLMIKHIRLGHHQPALAINLVLSVKRKVGSIRGIPAKNVENLRQEMKKINRKKMRIKIQTTLSVQL